MEEHLERWLFLRGDRHFVLGGIEEVGCVVEEVGCVAVEEVGRVVEGIGRVLVGIEGSESELSVPGVAVQPRVGERFGQDVHFDVGPLSL